MANQHRKLLLTAATGLVAAASVLALTPTASEAGSSSWLPNGEPNCAVLKCVALTYDDGPSQYTGKVLDALSAGGARATFYVLANPARQNKKMLQRIHREGHEVGNHSVSHRPFVRLTNWRIRYELRQTDKSIRQAIGSKPATVRPPYGSLNARVLRQLDRPAILWDVDTLDWQHNDPSKVIQAVKRDVRPGSIILMHDTKKASANATPGVIWALKQRGYRFVTVSTLLRAQKPKAGKKYRHLRPAGTTPKTWSWQKPA